ncbi:uncharacterized protein LOC124273208 [Haliotis rubra]|uniref:uncharacterized protein LOC124273208 n=1 Tax=Haliotis rubra TaxID=36100 RepID=UPI001EE60587|nr:uncharacterized protein LOC124273208 [Haliotis rubra]
MCETSEADTWRYWKCLLFGAALCLGARCENTENEEQLFFVTIVPSSFVQNQRAVMTAVNDVLYSVKDITVKQAFKIVGKPRVVAILKFRALCDWRPLEEALAAAGLSIDVKSLYGELDLENDLKVDKELLANAQPPSNISGEFIYLLDVTLLMSGQTGASYKEELRSCLELSLKYRANAHKKFLNYNVLGEFPIQMLFFDVADPKVAESLLWPFNEGPLAMTVSMTRVENFADYLNNNYCN